MNVRVQALSCWLVRNMFYGWDPASLPSSFFPADTLFRPNLPLLFQIERFHSMRCAEEGRLEKWARLTLLAYTLYTANGIVSLRSEMTTLLQALVPSFASIPECNPPWMKGSREQVIRDARHPKKWAPSFKFRWHVSKTKHIINAQRHGRLKKFKV